MSPTQKQLELRMKVTADVSDAQRNLQQLAAAQQQAQGRGGAPGFSGYVPPAGFGSMGQVQAPAPPAGSGAAPPRPGPFGSPVPAFDRPIPVIIVGPRPLQVTGAGAGGPGGPNKGEDKDKTADLLASLRNLQLGGVVGRYEQIKAFGDAAKDLGIPGGKLIGRAAVPLTIGLTAMKTAGEVGDLVSDEYMTGEQMGRAAVRKFVPFGETIQQSIDGISGRRAGMERAELDHQKQLALASSRVQIASINATFNPDQAAASTRAGLLAGANPVLEGTSDRTTAAGEKAFRDRMRLLPLERESAKAEREAAVAAASRTTAGAELLGIENRMNQLRRESTRLARQIENDPDAQSGVRRQQLLFARAAAENEFQGMGGVRQQARQSVFQATQAEALARQRAGMVGVQRLQTEADILESDASQAASGAQSLGGMDRFSRANSVRSLQLLMQYGPERMSPRELAEARAVAPQTVAKILEQSGKGTREFDSLRQLAPADYAGDPDELRRKAADKRDEAARKELDLERDASRAVSAAGTDLGKYLIKTMREVVESAIREMEISKRIGKGASS